MIAAASQRPPPTPPPSRLGAVKRGKIRAPLRVLVYGPEGVGKSSLAAGASGVLFADIENSTKQLDVPRYPFRDEEGGHVPRTFDEVTAMLDDLERSPRGDYGHLVIDTADELEALLHRHICQRDGKANVTAYGYGKGFDIAVDAWRALVLSRLDRLHARGWGIVFTAHSLVKSFKNPTGDDYDRYQPKLHEKAAGLLKGWCDVVAFIAWDDVAAVRKTESDKQGARAKGFGGERMAFFERTAAWDAKARIPLPERMPLDADGWAAIAAAHEASFAVSADELRQQIAAEMARLNHDPSIADMVADRVARAGENTGYLIEIVNRLRAREAAPKES
jgi:AAA domain-containing protein